MVDVNKTLCKQCKQCKTIWYERTTNKGKTVDFKYCEGNKTLIKQFNYGYSHPKTRPTVTIINSLRYGSHAEERGKSPTRYMKKDKNKVVYHINHNQLDLRLKNLREVTRGCLQQELQKGVSEFPGVHLKHGKYHSKLKTKDNSYYLGSYTDEMDAYHAYVLKHKELGIEINKETKAHKTYLKQYDPKKFEKWEKGKLSHFKGVTKRNDKFISVGTKKGGKRQYIAEFKREVDAFHAYVLWCMENDKEVYTEYTEYQDFLEKEQPSNDLKEFIKSRRKKPTSKYPNVMYYKNTGKWVAKLTKKGELLYQEYFEDEYEAHLAVERKRNELNKEK